MKRSQFNPGEQGGSIGLFSAIFGSGQSAGAEVPRQQEVQSPVPKQEVIKPKNGSKVTPTTKEVSIGITQYGEVVNLPLFERATLVCGQSGSGKSFCSNRILMEIFKIPIEQRVVVGIDLKSGSEVGKSQRCLDAFGIDIETADRILTNVTAEMDRRHRLINSDPAKYWDGKTHPSADMPLIVVFVDELAMLGKKNADKELEEIRKHAWIQFDRLLYLGRNAAICTIACIQRPDAKIVDSFTRAQFQNKLAGYVSSRTDSEVILGPGTAEIMDASKLSGHWFYASIEGKREGYLFKTPGDPGDEDLRSVFLNPQYYAPEGRGSWLTAENETEEAVAPWWKAAERRKNAEKDSISWDSAYRRNDSYDDDDDAYDEGDDLGAEFDENPGDDLPFDEESTPNRPASSQQSPAPAPVDLATMAAMLGVSVEQLEELQRQNGTNPQPASSRTSPRSAPSRPTRGERAAAREARAAAADSLVVETRKASRRPLTDEQIVERGADLMRDVFREIDDYLDEQEELGAEFSEEEDDELIEDVDDTPIATSDDDDFGLDLDTPDVSNLPEFASGPEELVRKTRRMNMETEFSGLRNLVTSGSTTNGPDSRPEAEWEGNRKQPIPAPPHRRPAVASSEHPVDKEGQEPGGLTVERRRQARQAKPDRADTTAKKEQPASAAKPSASGGRGKRTAPARQRNYQRR